MKWVFSKVRICSARSLSNLNHIASVILTKAHYASRYRNPQSVKERRQLVWFATLTIELVALLIAIVSIMVVVFRRG